MERWARAQLVRMWVGDVPDQGDRKHLAGAGNAARMVGEQSPAASSSHHSPSRGPLVIFVVITSGHVSVVGHFLPGGGLSSSLPLLPRISLSV